MKIGGLPWPHRIIQTKNKGFLIGGSYSDSDSFPHSWTWVAKTDSEGNLLWENKFGNISESFLGFYENGNEECHIFYTSSIVNDKGLTHYEYIEAIVENNGETKSSINYSVMKYPKLISEDGLVFTDFKFEIESQQNIERGIGLQVMKINVNEKKEWENTYEWIDTSKTYSTMNSEIIRTDDGGYMITGTRYYFL